MVGVAQLVRASGCGPEGRGFESHHSPHKENDTARCRFLYGVNVILRTHLKKRSFLIHLREQ